MARECGIAISSLKNRIELGVAVEASVHNERIFESYGAQFFVFGLSEPRRSILGQATLAGSRGRENCHQRVCLFIGNIALFQAFFSGFKNYTLGLLAVVECASNSMGNSYQLNHKATKHIKHE